MPKSFSLNALYRPILASLVALSAFAPSAARTAEQPPFLQVMEFDDVMALPVDAREKYFSLLRETLVYMAESDAGTDHEFFGANDSNAPIVMNGWRGGHYAILKAFMPSADAALPSWLGGPEEPLTYESYLEQRAVILNADVTSAPRIGNTSEGPRAEKLRKLETEWKKKQAADQIDAEANKANQLTAQSYEKRKQEYEKTIRETPANAPYGRQRDKERAEENLKNLNAQWEIAKNAPKKGEKNDCPPEYYAIKSCFVSIDDKTVGILPRMDACKKAGGVMARPGSMLNYVSTENNSQCLTKAYFDKMKAKGWTEATQMMANKEELCMAPDIKCKGSSEKLDAKKRAEFAKALGNQCIFAGNVSSYKLSRKTERSAVRKGMCEGPRKLSFGQLTVECSGRDEVLCNPILFDASDRVPADMTKPTTIKGLCVPRRKNSTELCKAKHDEESQKDPDVMKNRFWNSPASGIKDEYKKLTDLMNRTCTNSAALGMQCKECQIMQTALKTTKLIAKTCDPAKAAAAAGTGNAKPAGPKKPSAR